MPFPVLQKLWFQSPLQPNRLHSVGFSLQRKNLGGYTMFRGSVKSTSYPLHSPVSPSLPLPYVTVCRHISTGLYSKLKSADAVTSVSTVKRIVLRDNAQRFFLMLVLSICLGDFAKLRRLDISCVMSVLLSVRLEQLNSH
jgi:hypothetical protein